VNALTPFLGNGLPPGRRALVDLNKRILDAERDLGTLTNGRDRLRAELSRADSAKNELDALVMEDSSALVGKLRSGASWALSHFGSVRALNLMASLSESGLQRQVGEKALSAIEAEIAVADREVADLKARRPDAVHAVLLESAGGFRTDLLTAIDHLREAMTTLAALDRVTSITDGSYRPNDRVVVEIPAFGSLPAQVVISPETSIERAQGIWHDFESKLANDPLADIENIHFPLVNGNEDEGRILYDKMTETERSAVDRNRSQGVA
jgi:hypothetical protein